MSLESFDELSEMHLDVIREIGNIGSGSAASSLSQALGRTVDIEIPQISLDAYDKAYENLGGVDTAMLGILLLLTGDLNGMMMFLLPVEIACELVNLLMFTEISEYAEIDEIGQSAITEMANIMSASFVNAISEMTGLTIDISTPMSTMDMLGSIMSVPAIYYAQMGDKLMYMKNDLVIEGKKSHTNILLLPDAESLERLISSLGIEI